MTAEPGQLTRLLIVQGFSLCFMLSNMCTAYMCFADKKRKMNLQTLSQARQESTVWTKWKLDCFIGWSQHWCPKISDHIIVLSSGTQQWKEEESKADLQGGGKLKEKWRAFFWGSKLTIFWSALKERNHWINYSLCWTLANRNHHKTISYFSELWFTVSSTHQTKNSLKNSQPFIITCGWK